MMYRAKFTKIQSWIEENYNLNAYNIRKDAKDLYLELKDEEEAELIEKINRAQTTLLDLKNEWYKKYDNEK